MNKKSTIPTALLDNVNRRREQLRRGQRAHRERKNRRVKDLEARVKELEATVLDLESELRSARILGSSPQSLSGIVTNENVATPLSTYTSPLGFAALGAIETSCSEHPSLCLLGEGDVSISSYDVSMSLAETTEAQGAPTIPATLPTESLALHQRLEYRTVQRTLEYILTYDLVSLNRVFMFHVSDPSIRHSYMHPEASEANRLLSTVLLRGYFAFEWPPVIIPLAEETLTKHGNYMDARQVEDYLTTFREAYPLCLSLRADDFIATPTGCARGCKMGPSHTRRLSTQSRKTELLLAKSNWALPVDEAPYLAVKVTCGITFTFGGLAVNPETAQVISAVTDKETPGLYCAGEMLGGLFYDNYLRGSGLTSGAAFGCRAGTAAARATREKVREFAANL
ncbi:hypothetical protein V500_11263 [Pseudogymnoascus sp. VKM F-4518 (FW-2643)]|nr:hypothetical protein V500_11263 [Pseudogymnoascus sp. VKM F-4518 (FW-2643)]